MTKNLLNPNASVSQKRTLFVACGISASTYFLHVHSKKSLWSSNACRIKFVCACIEERRSSRACGDNQDIVDINKDMSVVFEPARIALNHWKITQIGNSIMDLMSKSDLFKVALHDALLDLSP